MWGVKGGRKEGRMYPTVQNVMVEFYQGHPSSEETEFSIGEIPKLTWSCFRYFTYFTIYLFGIFMVLIKSDLEYIELLKNGWFL